MGVGDSTFSTVRFSQIATAEARNLILKESPAVYAWYRSLDLASSTTSASRFLAAIEILLSAKLSDRFSGRLGYLYEVSVQEAGGGLGERNRDLLERISRDPTGRLHLASILQTATYLQAPLYVGKALNLRQRIGEHVTGVSGLLGRLSEAALPMESCVLRYRYIDGEDEAALASAAESGPGESAANEVALLIEELLTRLSPSAFVRRPG